MWDIPSFSQFRSDMMTKWRYKYGDPAVREALWRSEEAKNLAMAQQAIPAQADLYRAQATLGIPSEAELRRAQATIGIPATADYQKALTSKTMQDIEMQRIDNELLSRFAVLFHNKFIKPLLISTLRDGFDLSGIGSALPQIQFELPTPTSVANKLLWDDENIGY